MGYAPDRVYPVAAVDRVRPLPNRMQTGTIVDVAAELEAALHGADAMAEVREAARGLLVRTGSGTDVIGTEMWYWQVVRAECRRRNRSSRSIAAIRRMGLFDDRRSVGDIVKGSIRPPSERQSRLARMSGEVTDHVRARGDVRIEDPAGVANWFMSEVGEVDLPPDIDVRGGVGAHRAGPRPRGGSATMLCSPTSTAWPSIGRASDYSRSPWSTLCAAEGH